MNTNKPRCLFRFLVTRFNLVTNIGRFYLPYCKI
jgi:hypothetical protein